MQLERGLCFLLSHSLLKFYKFLWRGGGSVTFLKESLREICDCLNILLFNIILYISFSSERVYNPGKFEHESEVKGREKEKKKKSEGSIIKTLCPFLGLI